MSDDVHLVVALCGALVAILGLIFLAAFLLERCKQLREERDALVRELVASDTLLARMGVRRGSAAPPPKPERGQL